MQVVIAGCGPSGLFAATACAKAGLSTLVIAPTPRKRWEQRLCTWEDDWPDSYRQCLGRRWLRPRVVLADGTSRRLDRTYAQIDNDRLQDALWANFQDSGGIYLDAQAQECCHDELGTSLATTAGNVRTKILIDATGSAQALLSDSRPATQFQTAVGAVVSRADGNPVDPVATFMDFRPADSEYEDDDLPSFLYTLPLDTHRLFIEETVLTSYDPKPHETLRQRLNKRIAASGFRVLPNESGEHCVIAMDADIPTDSRVLGFGIAGGMVHPASGFSVARSANASERLAKALCDAQDLSADTAVAKAALAIWGEDQKRRWALFGFGRDILSRLDTRQTQRFFEAFFQLDDDDIADWLSDRMNSRRLAGCMLSVFRRASNDIRTILVLSALRQPAVLMRGLMSYSPVRKNSTQHREAA